MTAAVGRGSLHKIAAKEKKTDADWAGSVTLPDGSVFNIKGWEHDSAKVEGQKFITLETTFERKQRTRAK